MKPSTQISATVAVLSTAVGIHASPYAAQLDYNFFGERATAMPTMTRKGCYHSSTGLTFNSTYMYMTQGYCQPLCVEADNYFVLGLTEKTDCWCGNQLPPSDKLVDDSYCDAGCAGYDTDPCGSEDGTYWTVYLTGVRTNVANATDDETTSSSTVASTSVPTSTKTAAPSLVTVGTTVITVTASAQAASASAAEASSQSNKSNTAGIIAGVVIGIVLVAALAGGAFLWLRHKRRREIEKEYQRNASIDNFVANGKPPTSSAGYSNHTDTRLDHSALQRRMSDGSIADNEDYSRKILRVTNA